jgi:hypothetical protein
MSEISVVRSYRDVVVGGQVATPAMRAGIGIVSQPFEAPKDPFSDTE